MIAKRLLVIVTVLIVMVGLSSTMAQEYAPRAYTEQDILTADIPTNGDELGFAVSLSLDGNTALAGAPNAASFNGAAFVYTRTGGTWSAPVKLTPTNGTAGESFGYSVALSGDGMYAIVGAYQSAGGGAAYIFALEGTTWTQKTKLIAGDADSGAQFGRSVAINGDGTTVLVGAMGDNQSTGAAYAFVRNSQNIWVAQGGKLTANDAATDAFFGSSVALSTNGVTALIGAKNASISGVNGVGAAYVFTRSNTGVWGQAQKLTVPGGLMNDQFGESVSLSGGSTYAIIGAKGVGGEIGAAYIFLRENNMFGAQPTVLTPPSAPTGAKFGIDVAMGSTGKVALVGAPGLNSSMGAAFVYTRTGSTWTLQPNPLMGSDSGDFGASVALNGDGSTALVGANKDNSARGSVYAFFDAALISTNTPIPPTATTAATTTPESTPTETPVPRIELVGNGGFELQNTTGASILASWQQKGAVGDKIRCNKIGRPGKPDKIFAKTGNCAYGFKGGAGENSKIQQNADLALVTLAAGDTLDLSLFFNATNAAATGKIKVRVKYSDNTETGKITENIVGTSDYTPVSGTYTLLSPNVTRIRVQVQNRSRAGKVYVDDVSLLYTDAGSGLFPLP